MLLEETDPLHRNEIGGTTDSEHIFRYLLSLWMHDPGQDLLVTVRRGIEQIVEWASQVAPDRFPGLNIVLTDGDHMVGTRMNRTLWFIERDHTYECPICHKPHVHHEVAKPYRAAEVASEAITNEPGWKRVPNGTVFSVDPDYCLRFEPLANGKYLRPET
jgi:glutamine amidotransferase